MEGGLVGYQAQQTDFDHGARWAYLDLNQGLLPYQ